jgi:hypothetical protein
MQFLILWQTDHDIFSFNSMYVNKYRAHWFVCETATLCKRSCKDNPMILYGCTHIEIDVFPSHQTMCWFRDVHKGLRHTQNFNTKQILYKSIPLICSSTTSNIVSKIPTADVYSSCVWDYTNQCKALHEYVYFKDIRPGKEIIICKQHTHFVSFLCNNYHDALLLNTTSV